LVLGYRFLVIGYWFPEEDGKGLRDWRRLRLRRIVLSQMTVGEGEMAAVAAARTLAEKVFRRQFAFSRQPSAFRKFICEVCGDCDYENGFPQMQKRFLCRTCRKNDNC